MYEPSKELIEQIAKEYRDLMFSEMESSSKEPCWDNLGYFCRLSKDICNLPTINKALELYENQPKWQDKPDKEGWWWVCSEEPASGAKFNRIVEIRGIPTGLRVWVGGFPTIEQYIGEYVRETKITWLHIPEPESYKGED